MKVTKQMIDDLFNLVTIALDTVAKVDPSATSLTSKQVLVDVLAKTFDSLKSDLEQYFLADDSSAETLITSEHADRVLAEAREIADTAPESTAGDFFEKYWDMAEALLDLILDTAKYNLPKDSVALAAMITSIDAVLAMGTQLKIDLPKLNNES